MMGAHSIRMVVGLGNPGNRYEMTRHNLGFMAVDAFKERIAAGRSWKKRGSALLCEAEFCGNKVYLLKPQCFMNLSGGPVAELHRFYKIPLNEIVVAHDDVDLPFGRLRVKKGGGDGGHNGLKSLRAELGSGDFLRVRCGIGRPQRVTADEDGMVQWVLGRFSGADVKIAEEVAAEAAEALLTISEKGLEQAQRDFNRRDVALKVEGTE